MTTFDLKNHHSTIVNPSTCGRRSDVTSLVGLLLVFRHRLTVSALLIIAVNSLIPIDKRTFIKVIISSAEIRTLIWLAVMTLFLWCAAGSLQTTFPHTSITCPLHAHVTDTWTVVRYLPRQLATISAQRQTNTTEAH